MLNVQEFLNLIGNSNITEINSPLMSPPKSRIDTVSDIDSASKQI